MVLAGCFYDLECLRWRQLPNPSTVPTEVGHLGGLVRHLKNKMALKNGTALIGALFELERGNL